MPTRDTRAPRRRRGAMQPQSLDDFSSSAASSMTSTSTSSIGSPFPSTKSGGKSSVEGAAAAPPPVTTGHAAAEKRKAPSSFGNAPSPPPPPPAPLSSTVRVRRQPAKKRTTAIRTAGAILASHRQDTSMLLSSASSLQQQHMSGSELESSFSRSDLISTSQYGRDSTVFSGSYYSSRGNMFDSTRSNSNSNSNSSQHHRYPTDSTNPRSRRRRPRFQSSKSRLRWPEASAPVLSRGKFAKRYFSDSLLMSSSRSNSLTSSFLSTAGAAGKRVSFSSSSSPTGVSKTMPLPSCYVPVPMNPEAAAALEHDILLASSYSNSSLLYDDSALFEMARAAKKKVESAAKRQVMVGKWKPLVFAGQDCHVFESRTKAKDQYSVVAKLNLPCSLHEIMSVFSSETSPDFHRSMVMLFGELYVYGLNVRSVDCAPYRRSSWAGRSSSKMRRSSHPLDPSKSHFPHPSAVSSSSKLAVNAVSLLMRHHLMWRQQNMSFVDYVEEKFDAKSVTRVLQTMDAHDDESERTSPLEAHESHQHMRGLRGLLAGYVLQEDSEEKFTRLFFYASHKNPDVKNPKLILSVVQLLREMAMKLCKLESIVLRRRLGFYPMVAPSEVALLQTACCASCYLPFSVLRKKHFCYLCGQYTCRKCSKVEDIEKVLGMIDRRRVCVSCVRRVSYCVFTMADGKYQQSQKAKSLSDGSALADVPEEEFPPVLAEDDLALTEIEDLAAPEDYYASNDVAVEKMSKYIQKVLERNVGFPRRNPIGADEESSGDREQRTA